MTSRLCIHIQLSHTFQIQHQNQHTLQQLLPLAVVNACATSSCLSLGVVTSQMKESGARRLRQPLRRRHPSLSKSRFQGKKMGRCYVQHGHLWQNHVKHVKFVHAMWHCCDNNVSRYAACFNESAAAVQSHGCILELGRYVGW